MSARRRRSISGTRCQRRCSEQCRSAGRSEATESLARWRLARRGPVCAQVLGVAGVDGGRCREGRSSLAKRPVGLGLEGSGQVRSHN